MADVVTKKLVLTQPAAHFNLLGVDGTRWDLNRCRGAMGMLMIFVANQCPHVKEVRSKLISEIEQLKAMGIGTVAINSNDPSRSPEDSYPFMRTIAKQYNFDFPYLVDDQQIVAKAYGASCTPELFGFNANMELQYHGRLGYSKESSKDFSQDSEMLIAMRQVALSGIGPSQQFPSSGSAIKWANELKMI
ncbi:MAG: redoxin domain-containing protein [Gammaproteobacteria bacterium]|nr:redoxin domain-containing protein [Gammaproteobacteria bacterium]